MVYSSYKKQRIIYYRFLKGFRPPKIKKVLQQEGMVASERGIRNFIKTYIKTGNILSIMFCPVFYFLYFKVLNDS